MTQALFSDDRKYRFMLFVEWDPSKPKVSSIGMNPSLADESRSDPTITKEINYVKSWGGGSLMKLNLFGLISPYPKALGELSDPIGQLNTPEFIAQHCEGSMFTLATWGDYRKYVSSFYRYRWLDVAEKIPNLQCFKQSAITGMPYHPLYLPKDLTPIPFSYGG